DAPALKARVNLPAIGDERSVGVEYASPCFCRADQVSQHRRDDLGVDPEGQFGARQAMRYDDLVLVVRLTSLRRLVSAIFARLLDRSRNDGSLRREAVYAGLYELNAILIEIENSRDKNCHAEEIENDDPAGDAVKPVVAEKFPRETQNAQPHGAREPPCRSFTPSGQLKGHRIFVQI